MQTSTVDRNKALYWSLWEELVKTSRHTLPTLLGLLDHCWRNQTVPPFCIDVYLRQPALHNQDWID